ncbi:glycine N-acyltransferase-like [Babylonia areolata]|uniref:glycine N-acyltransferase-like n=1 Tax=Babylonia areolata TaxID=304850 RepID=UPI003FD48BF6
MIFQLLTNEETRQLKDDLQGDLPGSAKMFYIVSNYLCGLLEGFEVIVDHWPQWTCAILRPQAPDAVASYFRQYYICHTRSVKAFRFFIQRPCVVDWSRPVCFTGVPYDAVPTLQELCRKHGGQLSSVENRFMYAWTNKDPPQQLPVPEGLTLTTLQPQHTTALCERWRHYRPDPALDLYMKEVVTRFDSSAIVNGEGELMAYIAMQFNGAMAMLHVEPACRGRGLGQLVLVDLTRKLLAQGRTAFGLIPTQDTSFIATSSQRLGFTWVPQGSMAWVRYQPPALPLLPPTTRLRSAHPVHPAFPASSLTLRGQSCRPLTSDPGKSVGREGEEEKVLHLTALPLSCNVCSDIGQEALCSTHDRIGIS